MNKITCSYCDNEYEAIDNNDTTFQGYECSAIIYFSKKLNKWLIDGHYGSTIIDLETYYFKKNYKFLKHDSNMCDKCIEKHKNKMILLSKRFI